MPQSRNRNKHHVQQQIHQQQNKSTGTGSAVLFTPKTITYLFFTAFVGLIGATIAFFLYKMNWTSVVIGAAIGGVIGYFIGLFVNKFILGK